MPARKRCLAWMISLCFLMLVGCSGDPQPVSPEAREWGSFVPEAPPDGYDVGSRPLVVMSLPIHGTLALLDPVERAIWHLTELERGTSGPMGIAVSAKRLVLTDVWGAGVSVLNARTGRVVDSVGLGRVPIAPEGHTIEPRRHGADVTIGPDGAIYVLVDEEVNGRGFAFKLDPDTLDVLGRTELGPYPAQMAFDDTGLLWTVGGYSSGGNWLEIIDPETMRSRRRWLPGFATDVMAGPRGSMFLPILHRGVILEMDDRGFPVHRLRGLGPELDGLSIGDGGEAILAANQPDRVITLDLERMQITGTHLFGEECFDVRETLILEERAVVTCAGNSHVAIIGLRPLRLIESVFVAERWPAIFGGEPSTEQARALALLPRLD